MKDKTVAILESRARDQIADLIRNHGGTPFVAPALAEISDVDPAHIRALIDDWKITPPDVFIFQTGVGTRALFEATDGLGLTDAFLRLLNGAQVVVRGPKPTAALRSRKVRIDLAANDPFTTREVLAELANLQLLAKRVVVQRYGETNRELQAALAAKGAQIVEITTYRWGLPDDTTPLQQQTLCRQYQPLTRNTGPTTISYGNERERCRRLRVRGRDRRVRRSGGLQRDRGSLRRCVCNSGACALRGAGAPGDRRAWPADQVDRRRSDVWIS